jgi:hypothetical protein
MATPFSRRVRNIRTSEQRMVLSLLHTQFEEKYDSAARTTIFNHLFEDQLRAQRLKDGITTEILESQYAEKDKAGVQDWWEIDMNTLSADEELEDRLLERIQVAAIEVGVDQKKKKTAPRKKKAAPRENPATATDSKPAKRPAKRPRESSADSEGDALAPTSGGATSIAAVEKRLKRTETPASTVAAASPPAPKPKVQKGWKGWIPSTSDDEREQAKNQKASGFGGIGELSEGRQLKRRFRHARRYGPQEDDDGEDGNGVS